MQHQDLPYRVFGIRHHGPGSARSLVQALEEYQPDLILVEGPPDAEALLDLASAPDMVPPVALLVYNPKNLRQASFFPFAEFSPEWQAIQFGNRMGIPVRFMDLPMQVAFGLQATEADIPQLILDLPEEHSGPDSGITADPFAAIARLAGYADPERWWEATFERRLHRDDPATDVFTTVLELMEALRASKSDAGAEESGETLLREAFMRQTLRQALKSGNGQVAVICGAWHAPALLRTAGLKAADDAPILRGLKKIKTQSTWIPWSFDRLTKQSGYGAGITAPAWYQELWNAGAGRLPGGTGSSPHAVWFSRAAQLLREHDLILSSAHVIEAVRLAEALAALRQTLLPGIEELREAAVTVLCGGAEKPFELIGQHLITGDVLGRVPASVPVVPLKADFDAQVRSARLKLHTTTQSLALDLREPAHQHKSRLLHRLRLLEIPWGEVEQLSGRREGLFHENWTLRWLPDYEIQLIEAGPWGNTIESAAARKTHDQVKQADQLPTLINLLDQALKADLPAILPLLIQKLGGVSAVAQDALALAETILPLVEVARYGSARQIDLGAVEHLLEQIVPRVCIQLPGACIGLSPENATSVQPLILSVHRALGLWQRAEMLGTWGKTLGHIADQAAPLLAGLGCRLLFEQQLRTPEDTAREMQFRLSLRQSPFESAQWLEGFLFGSGLLLLHQPALWRILDDWVGNISVPDFPELLPLLRRTFSRFAAPEREKMLDLARNKGGRMDAEVPAGWDEARAAKVRPILQRILGGQ